MSIQQTEVRQLDAERPARLLAILSRTRRWQAGAIDARMRVVMIAATLLVIPDLVLEEQPLRASWHTVAVIGDWLIWLVFLVEFAVIVVFAEDWRSWLRRYPLAPAILVLTPPFAPPAIQALRLFRLLRLLRVARGVQLLSNLLTLDGLKYVATLAVSLVVGGGVAFAEVQSRAGDHVSTWDGIWWAIGTISTEGSHLEATTDATRAISIVLMLAGIGLFSILTGAVAQHFLASRSEGLATELSDGEKAIMARLDYLAARLDGLGTADVADLALPRGSGGRIASGRRPSGATADEIDVSEGRNAGSWTP